MLMIDLQFLRDRWILETTVFGESVSQLLAKRHTELAALALSDSSDPAQLRAHHATFLREFESDLSTVMAGNEWTTKDMSDYLKTVSKEAWSSDVDTTATKLDETEGMKISGKVKDCAAQMQEEVVLKFGSVEELLAGLPPHNG